MRAAAPRVERTRTWWQRFVGEPDSLPKMRCSALTRSWKLIAIWRERRAANEQLRARLKWGAPDV
jgi:hypothetical protein